MFENIEGYMLGFLDKIQISGLYRKVREGSSLISCNFHQNLTTGSLVNTQKRHSPRMSLFSFMQYSMVLIC